MSHVNYCVLLKMFRPGSGNGRPCHRKCSIASVFYPNALNLPEPALIDRPVSTSIIILGLDLLSSRICAFRRFPFKVFPQRFRHPSGRIHIPYWIVGGPSRQLCSLRLTKRNSVFFTLRSFRASSWKRFVLALVKAGHWQRKHSTVSVFCPNALKSPEPHHRTLLRFT